MLRSGEEREAANTDRDGIYIYKSLILPEVRTGYFQNPYGCVYLLKLLSTTKQLNCKSWIFQDCNSGTKCTTGTGKLKSTDPMGTSTLRNELQEKERTCTQKTCEWVGRGKNKWKKVKNWTNEENEKSILTEAVASVNVNGTWTQKHDEYPAKCPQGCMTLCSVSEINWDAVKVC